MDKQERIPQERVNDVHIAVFFDGTNNNMVQHAYYHTFEKEKSKWFLKDKKEAGGNQNPIVSQKVGETDKEFADRRKKHTDSLNHQNLIYSRVKEIIEKREQKNVQLTALLSELSMNSSYNVLPSPKNTAEYNKLRLEIIALDEELEQLQVETHLNIESMHSDSQSGFSNVAILHSLLKTQINSNSLYYNLYVEGSGANDIVTTGGYIDGEKNPNGLGFGLGKTGVTALVSKAIKYIHKFLICNKTYLNGNTKYHFYVFGFSRGSTCARLFSELATRKVGETLPRENEFGEDTSKVKGLFKDGRLPFMENGFLGEVPIIRTNVAVDFLGIYDTVASIGFLKQKDGWTNALSWGYRMFWWNNYNGNFHYKNASDYGLYSPQNEQVKHTCHICAGDEFRENFALVNLGKKLPETAIEIIIPGCHSDVGGGYVDKIDQDIVLYKFVPRKLERFLKHNKILEVLGFFYLNSKERAKMFIEEPFREPNKDLDNVKVLNPETLARLGWIGSEWGYSEEANDSYDIDPETRNCFTKRVADWPNEIKFKRYVKQGYSNIPLNMMLKRVEKHGFGWLFNSDTYPYEIPKDIKKMGDEMVQLMEKLPDNKRMWILPEGGYSGNIYKKLRLKYIHFTSSCEFLHFRSPVNEDKLTKLESEDFFNEKENLKVKDVNKKRIPYEGGKEENFFEWMPGNIGNNCNYDNNANICRIMYDGDKSLAKDYKENIHYLYNLETGYGLEKKSINGDEPQIMVKRSLK